MLTINKLIPGGRGLAGVLLKRAAHVELDWDVRQKSRFDAVDSSGRALGVFLPRGSVVRGGDVLVAEDGSLVVVRAAAQKVLVVRHCAEHGSSFDLLRAAFHLGNRHVQLQLAPDQLTLEPDPILADMLQRQHLLVSEAMAPFEPESGAYSTVASAAPHRHVASDACTTGHTQGGDHGHAHTHTDGHAHDHGHPPAPATSPRHDDGDGHRPGPGDPHRH